MSATDRHDLERMVLAALCGSSQTRSGLKASDLVDEVTSNDFIRASHGQIFSLLLELDGEGVPPVAPVLRARIAERRIPVETWLVDDVCDTSEQSDVRHAARMIHEAALARRINTTLPAIVEVVNAGNLAEARQQLLDLADVALGAQRVGAVGAAEVMSQVIKRIEERAEATRNGESLTGSALPLGLKGLENQLHIERGHLFVLAARPGMGKSALATQIALANGAQHLGCFYASLEMQSWELGTRAAGVDYDVPVSSAFTGSITDDNLERLRAACNDISQQALFFDDRASVTVERIWAEARRLKTEHPTLALVVVDHIGLVKASDPRARKVDQVGHITQSLKKMAKDLDICVLALSQLNRGVEQRPDKRPVMSDLRDSGRIEEDADVVCFLYRDNVYNPATPPEVAELIVAKQRNGRPRNVNLTWQGECVSFRDPTPQYSYQPGGGW